MTATADGPGLEELARRVDAALADAAALEERPRQVADAVRTSIEAVHRAALVAVVRRLRSDAPGREALHELVDDPVVRMVLSLHGIVRTDTPLPQPPAPPRPAPVTIPLTALGGRRARPEEAGWADAGEIAGLADGRVTAVTLRAAGGPEVDVALVRVGDGVRAFRDECAHQALPLGGALVDVAAGTLTCPWHGYCYDLSGACLSEPGAELERLPVRVESGRVHVRTGS